MDKTPKKIVYHYERCTTTVNEVTGLLHSFDDEPSMIFDNGTKEWHEEGNRSRKGNKPAVVQANGREEYFLNGVRHRTNGSAICQTKFSKHYYLYGTMIQNHDTYIGFLAYFGKLKYTYNETDDTFTYEYKE